MTYALHAWTRSVLFPENDHEDKDEDEDADAVRALSKRCRDR